MESIRLYLSQTYDFYLWVLLQYLFLSIAKEESWLLMFWMVVFYLILAAVKKTESWMISTSYDQNARIERLLNNTSMEDVPVESCEECQVRACSHPFLVSTHTKEIKNKTETGVIHGNANNKTDEKANKWSKCEASSSHHKPIRFRMMATMFVILLCALCRSEFCAGNLCYSCMFPGKNSNFKS